MKRAKHDRHAAEGPDEAISQWQSVAVDTSLVSTNSFNNNFNFAYNLL